MIFFYILLGIVLVTAVFFDLRSRTIPNWLTLPAVPLALILAALLGGSSLFLNHLWGALICGGIWFIFWQAGWMGGGDQKLMLFVGAALGITPAPTAFLLVALAGGLQALGAITYRKIFLSSTLPEKFWKQIPLPYSIAIAMGTAATVLLAARHQLPFVL